MNDSDPLESDAVLKENGHEDTGQNSRRPSGTATRGARYWLRATAQTPRHAHGGKWTYEITPSATGAWLRITEDGEVYNPLFRFMSQFVFGQHATIDTYLNDLGRRLNQSVTIMD